MVIVILCLRLQLLQQIQERIRKKSNNDKTNDVFNGTVKDRAFMNVVITFKKDDLTGQFGEFKDVVRWYQLIPALIDVLVYIP